MVTILSRGSQGLFKYELIVFRKGLEVLVSIKVEIEAFPINIWNRVEGRKE